MRQFLLTLALIVVPAEFAWGWGEEGHTIIGEIDQRRLDAETLAKIKRLLGGEISLASIGNWAHDYRATNGETSRWHFVDIPLDRNTYNPAVDCKKEAQGDCIIDAVERARASCSKTANEKL
jgi:nuclease S1